MILLLVVCILGYLLGSIPSAVWIGKWSSGIDVREHGSKNAGATNTFRVLGKKCGWAVLTIDVLKGVLAVSIPLFCHNYFLAYKDEELILQLCASTFCILGHIFPLFAQFRGGKGVATALGITLGLNPVAASISLLIFLVIFLISRYVSLGAISASFFYPFISYFVVKADARIMIIFTVVLGFSVIIAHRKNINRLLKGEENRMNLLKRKA
jgi:glycerol-3-phosphate acyltransferase PlsY